MSILGAVFTVYNLDLDLRNLTTWKCQQINGKMRNKLTHKHIWRLHTFTYKKIQQLDRESVKIWTLPTLPTLPTYQPRELNQYFYNIPFSDSKIHILFKCLQSIYQDRPYLRQETNLNKLTIMKSHAMFSPGCNQTRN